MNSDRLKHLFALAMTTIVVASISGCITPLELAYDDGASDQEKALIDLGAMYAMRFTPPSGALLVLLVKANFYIYSDPATFKVHVMDSTHQDLITPFEATPTSEGWFEVGLPSPLIIGPEDFYIAIEYVTYSERQRACIPFLGGDTSSDAGRSDWSSRPPPPYTWGRYGGLNFMIRAVVLDS